MTLFFHLKAQTEQRFREAAMKKYGYSKGSLKTALEDAIGDWLEKQNDKSADISNVKESQPKETKPTKNEPTNTT